MKAENDMSVRIPIPANEQERLAALRRYEILDTPPEQSFDDITLIASQICGVPVALVSLLDEHRQWFKSNIGFDKRETPRQLAFCAHTIMQRDLLIINDTLHDQRFAQHPFVVQGPHIRFYAGAPLVTSDDHAVGTLCVIDQKPRQLTPGQKEALLALSRQVMAQLELRHALKQRERSEAELARLAAIVQHSDDAIISKTPEGIITSWNAGAEQMYGYRAQEVLGRSVLSLVPQSFLEVEQKVLARVCAGERVQHYQTCHVRKDGKTVDVSLTVSPLKDPQGRISGISCIARDISLHKQAEREIAVARKAAEEASRAKSEFLANMSHEIRTPMNGIIGLADLLLDTELSPQQRKYLEMMQTSADALMRIINDILDFSKIEAGRLELDEQPFSLREQLGNVVKTLGNAAAQKGLELALHVAKEVPEEVIADFGRLSQILLNLIGNAIKFTDQGEIVVDLSVEEERGDEVCLGCCVRDTGVGIPREKQQRIFQAFMQADTSTTRQYGGTGLGLTISARLVQLMRGRMWVESEPGQGSTFRFTAWLRLNRARQPVVPPELAEVRGMAVLIVDDNATNRLILSEMAERQGMKPTLADGAPAALRLMEAARQNGHPFKIVLVDLQMPEIDGLQLAAKIREGPEHAVPVLMLSSGGDLSQIRHARELGISSYLTKPVKESELMDSIKNAVGAEPAQPGTEPFAPAQKQVRRLNILLAEDSKVNQQVALGILQKDGHRVTVAENGRQAVELVQTQHFDLVLMDVQMPELDGYGAAQQIRQHERTSGQRVPILAMTGLAFTSDRERAMAAGMDGYISKPVRAAQLRELIAGLVAKAADWHPPQDSPAAKEDLAVFDEAYFKELTEGDPEVAEVLLDTFRAEAPKLLEHIHAAVERKEFHELEFAAHKLKGALGHLGAQRAQKLASELELRGETHNEAELVILREQLDTEISKVLERIAA